MRAENVSHIISREIFRGEEQWEAHYEIQMIDVRTGLPNGTVTIVLESSSRPVLLRECVRFQNSIGNPEVWREVDDADIGGSVDGMWRSVRRVPRPPFSKKRIPRTWTSHDRD